MYRGVDVSRIRCLENVPTGHTVIQSAGDGDNSIILFGGANQSVTERQIDEVLADFSAGDVLLLQNEISGTAHAINRAGEKGMIIVLNPSPMNAAAKALPLQKISYLFVNEVEASQLTGLPAEDAEGLSAALCRAFPQVQVILTLGAAGAYYLAGKERIYQNSNKDVVKKCRR
ncbi:PfkB family carbohydrate kinase [Lachnoclostridium sp. Marseille-P6806]|uniref:PfkB family carbohydrate kinase n=1 Tax=Lachnoclostridium sp. Marseille-P6806 TaxID=2364793 RepID=UPI0013EF3753|nr:PfkB family carbohydrate kinase [Lachnoclostridium sp. Marseille-P6806]